jgi:O-antigen ligase
MNDPFGIGYGGDSFGRAFKKIYPEYGKKEYHGRDSHSAILSLTIGIGIPGLMLWLVFVYTVVKVSIKNFKESYNYFSIMTLFIIMGMFSRSFVDTNMRDHVFLQYMIILGISLFFMIKGKSSAHIR